MQKAWQITRAAMVALTASGMSNAAPVTIGVIGDYGAPNNLGEPNANARAVAKMVAEWQPDFIVTVGDNNYGDNSLESASWDRLLGGLYGQYMLGRADNKYPLQTSPTQRFFPAIGNHDVQFIVAEQVYTRAGFLDYFYADAAGQPGRLPSGVFTDEHVYYDVQLGDAHFFIIDSDQTLRSAASARNQMVWLNDVLEDSAALWKFVVFHYAPYGSGYEANVIQMRWPFGEWGADAVFAGHDHLYERIERDDTIYYTVGNSGQELYELQNERIEGSRFAQDDDHGAMLLTIDGGTAVFESYSIGEGLIDRRVLRKPVPEPSGLAAMLAAAVIWWRRMRRVNTP